VFCVGGVQSSVTVPVLAGGAEFTAMENGVIDVLVLPSLTVMVTFAVVPTLELVGVPLRLPFCVLNVAHDGLFVMLNVNESLSASEADGVKL
jgi:hypothetical protein